VLLAIGGSTNGIVHLTAMAGRLGIAIDLAQLDAMGAETPVLLDLKPSGSITWRTSTRPAACRRACAS